MRHVGIVLIFAMLGAGCAPTWVEKPSFWDRNLALIDCHATCGLGPGPAVSSANLKLEDRPPRDGRAADGRFVGIALSGGGSRAANFGAAAMLRLKALDILDSADVISSVSGGSLPAIYYALRGYTYWHWSFLPWRIGHREIGFDEEEIRDRLYPHYQFRYLTRWFLPHHVFRYWLTSFNRTEIMYDVFDDYLFHGATYGDLTNLQGDRGPKLLVNAADRDDIDKFNLTKILALPQQLADPAAHKRFVFADERVRPNDLKTLPLSVAMTASSAVPGLFQNVTLPLAALPQQPREYLHLFDGMITDNTGLLTIMEMLQGEVVRLEGQGRTLSGTFPNGCVIIYIDAAPQTTNIWRTSDETRGIKDYLFDRALADAVDYILLPQREQILKMVGMTPAALDKPHTYVVESFPILPGYKSTCAFWHIPLRVIPEPPWIPTEFDMTEDHQNWLYEAACSIIADGWTQGAQKLLKSAQPVQCTGLKDPFGHPTVQPVVPAGPAPPAPSG
jgi:predicted acylesterase/phospholipase RssA